MFYAPSGLSLTSPVAFQADKAIKTEGEAAPQSKRRLVQAFAREQSLTLNYQTPAGTLTVKATPGDHSDRPAALYQSGTLEYSLDNEKAFTVHLAPKVHPDCPNGIAGIEENNTTVTDKIFDEIPAENIPLGTLLS